MVQRETKRNTGHNSRITYADLTQKLCKGINKTKPIIWLFADTSASM